MTACKYSDKWNPNCLRCASGEPVDTCIHRGRIQPRLGDPLTRDIIAIHLLKNGQYDIETDIEVTYETMYPDPVESHRVYEHNAEADRKEEKLTRIINPVLPEGCRIRTFHRHHTGKVAALHVHVWALCQDFSQARGLAEKLWKVLDPDNLEAELRND